MMRGPVFRARAHHDVDSLLDPAPRAPGPVFSGARIGLLGGSFNPPHQGHLLISRQALIRLRLDYVWWLPTMGNPLKPDPPAPLQERLAQCRALIDHPRILAGDLEARLGLRYSHETIALLKTRFSEAHFVWMIGADNLAELHHWRRWDRIMQMLPVAAFARPGATLRAAHSQTASRFARARLPMKQAHRLPGAKAPRWSLITAKTSALSSTLLREKAARKNAL